MADIRRIMYVDSVSSSSVQFRRHSQFDPIPSGDAGSAIHQMNLVTGIGSAATADTAFFQTGCMPYEIIIRRLG